MKRGTSHWWQVVFLLAGLAVPGCTTGPRLTVTEQADGVRSSLIEFKSWTRIDDSGSADLFFEYLCRRHGDDLLLRGSSFEIARSAECYAVTIENRFRTRRVPLEDWDAAKPLGVSWGKSIQWSATTVRYAWKEYERKGEHWHGAELSPGRRWLLLHSYDDKDWIKLRIEILGKADPRSGSTYLEIYDTVTGQRVFAAHSRSTDEIVYASAQWVGDDGRYLIQPVRGRSCLLVALPEVKQRNGSYP